MDFYIVDAFTDKPFGGNTAGVVLYNNCDEELMQKVASELKFSETAFIKQLSADTFYIRYFTPNSEIALCGHATIASFHVLKYLNLVHNNKIYILKTNSEFLSVEIQNDNIFMETSIPKSGVCLENASITALAKAMGIENHDIGDLDFYLKPEIISTGLYDIMLPVKTSHILNSMKPDFKALEHLSKILEVVGVHAFTINSSEYTANCRNFAPLYLINEECATGTSNASLTYYLYKNNVIKDFNRKYIFRQGEAMNRPSNILTKLIVSNNIQILVGGTASIISKGQLLL
ncbi:PhzF family phenazine biosynthesis protein [Clostridium sp. YIM B02515]|uniref:PhzF family phenazine biosynthesis protein n=1 Tax=Clostridium rhizosphaerae TaxID=2803861 RepID=A0ABS1TG77_9CLOT|nr:PhzF family phenazine biosynthesis protein [Clostridium rhizosphaerae]MBL4938379.1 PhzF family phenazine biosynthesis protein [Clostridium rhizosphaerae]